MTTIRTVEELGDAQAESDWGYVVVRDAEHRPWIVWDTEHGDWIATSFPSEDDPREVHGDEVTIRPPIIDARDIALPAETLHPRTVTKADEAALFSSALDQYWESICEASDKGLNPPARGGFEAGWIAALAALNIEVTE